MTAQTFCASADFMRYQRRFAALRCVSFGQNGWHMTRQAEVIRAPLMVRRHGQDVGVDAVTNLAIGIAADGMRHLRRRRVRVGWRSYGRLNDLGERRRIETGKGPFGSVARAVGAKRGIVTAARVARIMTFLTRRVEFGAMLNEPCGCLVRFGFIHAFERNHARLSCCGDNGNRMADVTFEPHGLGAVLSEMFAVVTAKTAGPIFMSDVVRMRCPIQTLFGMMQRGIQGLKLLNRVLDESRVLCVIVGIALFVKLFERGNGALCCRRRVVQRRQEFDAFLFDFGNRRVNLAVLQIGIHRAFGGIKIVRDAIVAVNTIHSPHGQLCDLFGRQWFFNVGVDGFGAVLVRDANPRYFLEQIIRVHKINRILDVPMDAASQTLAFRAAAGFHQERCRDGRIIFVRRKFFGLDNFVPRKFFGPMTFFARFARGL